MFLFQLDKHQAASTKQQAASFLSSNSQWDTIPNVSQICN